MKQQQAFTMIEAMVVVVIIAIVAAIASTSYQSFSAKGKWAMVQSCITDTTQRLENYRQNHGKYPEDDIWNSINSTSECGDYYEGTVTVFNDGTQYVVAYCDRKKAIWSSDQYDIWVTIDTRATVIHYRDPVENDNEEVDDTYEGQIDSNCAANW